MLEDVAGRVGLVKPRGIALDRDGLGTGADLKRYVRLACGVDAYLSAGLGVFGNARASTVIR